MSFFTAASQKRFVLKPIRHPNLWNIFKEQQSVLWTTEEILWDNDKKDWDTLDPAAQDFLLHIIAFFASSDMLVIDNLMDQFMSEVTVAECRTFYTLQAYIETIHSETYSTALEKFAPPEKKQHLFDALATEPTIQAKGIFADKYMQRDLPFEERLWAFCIFEGVLFAASFASLYWLRTKNKCKGLTFSNELIQRDESLHAKFGIEMLNMLENNCLDPTKAVEILKEAVAIEETIYSKGTPTKFNGTCHRTRYRVCTPLCRTSPFNAQRDTRKTLERTQPLAFMEMISIDSKTNFFEARVAEYTMAGVGNDPRQRSIPVMRFLKLHM